MDVDCPRPVDLSEQRLHLGVLDARVLDARVGQGLDGLVVDLPRPRLPEELGGLPEEDAVHLEHVLLLDRLRRAVEDGQGVPREAVLLLQTRVEHVQPPSKLRRGLLHGLLKEVARPLQLAAAVALDEAGEVGEPDVVHVRPAEHLDPALVDLERVLEVLALLQEPCVAEDHRRCRDLELDRRVVGRAGRGRGAQGLLEVHGQGPELGRAVQPALHGVLVELLRGLPLAHGPPHHRERLVVLPVPQLHLHPLAPDGGEVVDGAEAHVRRLLEDDPRVLQVVVGLVELGEGRPERPEPALGLLRVHGHDRLGEAPDDPLGRLPVEPHPLQPLVDVVGVLPQLHGGHELRPPAQEVLEARHEEVGLQGAARGRLAALEVRGHEALEELGVGVEDQGEVVDRADRGHGLLVDVPRLLELAQPDEVVPQGDPEPAHLVGELPDAAADDGLDVQGLDVRGVLGDEVAEVHPELVPRLALHGAEVLVVHDHRQPLRCLVVAADGAEVRDVDLHVVGLEHEVPSERAQRRLPGHLPFFDELHVELPDA
mmetsp:Transcript_50121/g.145341  ORF Transcript_50121/g.145341 Transcript_50121/m.145341 type:complete len:541 (+) Transcript_50121:926-2548(+)